MDQYHSQQQLKDRIFNVTLASEVALLMQLLFSVLLFNSSQDFSVIIFMALFFVNFYLIKKDRVWAAANYFLAVCTTLILFFVWRNAGLRDEIMLVFPALTAFAAMLGSMRTYIVLYVIIVINVFLIGIFNEFGIYTNPVVGSGIEPAIIIAIIFSVIGYGIYVLGRDLQTAVTELTAYKFQLEEKVELRTEELQTSLRVLKDTQSKLAESEKMAALGQMVSGVAHEINTPMGVSFTAASQLDGELNRLKNQFDQGTLTPAHLSEYLETARACSDLIQRNLNRSSNLISDFKNTAVTSEQLVSSSFYLGELIKDILNDSKADLDMHHVHCEVLGDRELMIQQDFGAIVQIVTSLIKNSCMHAFDRIELTPEIRISFELEDDQVVLNYRDNGIGIEASQWTSVFEPFFTTKRNQGGTGLGLTMVYNLVTHAMNGSITLLSPESGSGAAFRITFPNGLSK